MSSKSIDQIINYNNKTITNGLNLGGMSQTASLNPISGSATTTIITTIQESGHNHEQNQEQELLPVVIQTINQQMIRTNENFNMDSTQISFTYYDLIIILLITVFIFYIFYTK